MGLFGNRKRRVSVTVHGNDSLFAGSDGRYRKQAKLNRKLEKEKIRELVLEPHSPAELRGYIEGKYNVQELPKTDERYKRAYINVKSHLIFRDAPELIRTPALPMPDHPPVAEDDPDYTAYLEREKRRFRESVMVAPELYRMHLHVYNISIILSDVPIAWLEVYVESDHEYLGFSVTSLEYEEHYAIDRIKKDIVEFFGASKEDKKEKNERYMQLVSVQ